MARSEFKKFVKYLRTIFFMTLTREIKEFALDLGNSKVGITAAVNFTGYIPWELIAM